ncbi:hypothetical protein PM082_022167 [Marasmius tenuissimus]|nr:hypothetical protein PM082_022167 [Marasmius tenuissimus]
MLFAFPIFSQRSQIVYTLAEPDIKTLLDPQLTRAINFPDDFYIHRIIPIIIIDTGGPHYILNDSDRIASDVQRS